MIDVFTICRRGNRSGCWGHYNVCSIYDLYRMYISDVRIHVPVCFVLKHHPHCDYIGKKETLSDAFSVVVSAIFQKSSTSHSSQQ